MRPTLVSVFSLAMLLPTVSWAQTTQPTEKPMTVEEKKAATEKLRALCKEDVEAVLKTGLGARDILAALGKVRDAHLAQWKSGDQLGLPEGSLLVGLCYRYGSGVEPDYKKAYNLYSKSAESGCPQAMTNLARFYHEGQVVPKDDSEALKWYRKSAEAGNSEGMACLGFAFFKGWGVPEDYKEALKWFRQSAENGNPAGMLMLGNLYSKGIGVEKDTSEAAKWYRKILEGSDERAKNRARKALDELGEK